MSRLPARVPAVAPSGLLVVVVLLAAVPHGTTAAPEAVAQPEADNTVTRIHVYPNGTARWTIRIRTRLDTAEDVEQYRAFQSQFRNDTARFLDGFRSRIRNVVAAAENATGREMAAVGFTASTHIQEVPRRWGIVTYEFRWTGFAARSNGTLVMGDVFQGGLFLAENDTLVVERPAGYAIRAVAPPADSRDRGVLTWNGREDFGDERPRVRWVPEPNGSTPTATRTASTGPTPTATVTASPDRPTPTENSTAAPTEPTGPTDSGPASSLLLVGGAIAVLAVGLAVLLSGRFDALLAAGRRIAGVDDVPGDASDGETPPQTDSDAPAVAGAPEEGSATDEGDQGASPVMTDAERVEQALAANDGRMRQSELASALDWSTSKTSRVLSEMAENERVEKLRLGRENVIELRADEE